MYGALVAFPYPLQVMLSQNASLHQMSPSHRTLVCLHARSIVCLSELVSIHKQISILFVLHTMPDLEIKLFDVPFQMRTIAY